MAKEDDHEDEEDGVFFLFLLCSSLAFPFACACVGTLDDWLFFTKVGEHFTRRCLGGISLS